MAINEEVKSVIENSAFISLVTLGADGAPHLIVAGKGKVIGDTVVFGIYKMEITQRNLTVNPNAWIAAATRIAGGPKGYRLAGKAAVKGNQLIFTPEKAESLI